MIPKENTGLGSCEPLVTLLPTNQSITVLYVYFWLKAPYH